MDSLESATDVRRAAVEAAKVGAIEYLLKPIDRAALARSLDGILVALAAALREAEHGWSGSGEPRS